MSTANSATAVPAGNEDFETLLAQARRGSGPAMRRLYDTLNGEVAGYLRVRGATDVDAATNEVFHRAFTKLNRFKGNESGFRSWVFKIAYNLLIDEHRKRIRRPNVVASIDPDRHDTAGGDVEAEAMARLDGRDIAAIFDHLTESQREVMFLRIVAGLTLAEVADVLDRPVGAVKSLQHRAVESLRENFAKGAYPIAPSARSQR